MLKKGPKEFLPGPQDPLAGLSYNANPNDKFDLISYMPQPMSRDVAWSKQCFARYSTGKNF